MAQRKERRARRPAPTGAASGARAGGEAGETIAGLRRERDALGAELEAARSEIRALLAREADVLNRIDWVIDSLNSLLEDES